MEMLHQYEALFQGTGNLKGVDVKLEIDETVQPVAQPARCIPHSMTSKVNNKLQEMREEGINEKSKELPHGYLPSSPSPRKLVM